MKVGDKLILIDSGQYAFAYVHRPYYVKGSEHKWGALEYNGRVISLEYLKYYPRDLATVKQVYTENIYDNSTRN